jgi:hypothetical protein
MWYHLLDELKQSILACAWDPNRRRLRNLVSSAEKKLSASALSYCQRRRENASACWSEYAPHPNARWIPRECGRTVHASSQQTYGAPRVHAELQARDAAHGRKQIARLMRDAGLVGASHRRGGPTTTRRDKEARPAPDLVDLSFTASRPNQLWVADIPTCRRQRGSCMALTQCWCNSGGASAVHRPGNRRHAPRPDTRPLWARHRAD